MLRCTSKIIMEYVEDNELLVYLRSRHGIVNKGYFNQLVAEYNSNLILEAEKTCPRAWELVQMTRKHFHDKWTSYMCQYYNKTTFTFSCNRWGGPFCYEHQNNYYFPDVRQRCAKERIEYAKEKLTKEFLNFSETVCYLRLSFTKDKG